MGTFHAGEEHDSLPASPTVRRRALANALRRLRLSAGVSMDAAAEALEVSIATVSRYETGARVPRARDVRELCDLYRASDSDVEMVVALVSGAKETGWWQSYTEAEEFGISTFVGLEAAASAVDQYAQSIVPGLLQTQDYSYALYSGSVSPGLVSPMTDHDIRKMIEIRMRRQRRLEAGEGLQFSAVLDENVLRRPVGGGRVMMEQITHLVQASQMEAVTLRVLPFGVGAHPGQIGGFVILSLPQAEVPDIVYLESLAGATFLDSPDNVSKHRNVFSKLGHTAMSERSSSAWLESLRDHYRSVA